MASKVSIDDIALFYKDQDILVKTKVKASSDKPIPSEETPIYLQGLLTHLNMEEIEQNEILISLEENADNEGLKKRRKLEDRNVLRSICHDKLPGTSQYYLSVNSKFKGTLRDLIDREKSRLRSRGWVGGDYLIDVLSQIIQAVITVHRDDMTLGNISMESIYFVDKGDRPIIKVDPKVNYTVCSHGPLNERKRNDWRDVGTIIEDMQDLILKQRRPPEKSMDLVSLQDELRNANLDIGTVETFLDHPGLWDDGRGLLFLLDFVEKKIARMNEYTDPLARVIEEKKADILPVGCLSDWKNSFDVSHVTSMEDNRKEYMINQKMRRDNLSYRHAREMIDDEGKYKYNGNSTIDYLRFMRNCTSHFDRYGFASMYDCQRRFRRLQPKMLVTLYNIDKRHVANV